MRPPEVGPLNSSHVSGCTVGSGEDIGGRSSLKSFRPVRDQSDLRNRGKLISYTMLAIKARNVN